MRGCLLPFHSASFSGLNSMRLRVHDRISDGFSTNIVPLGWHTLHCDGVEAALPPADVISPVEQADHGICFSFVVLTGFYVLVEWILDDVRPRDLETTEESLVDTATLLSAVIEEDLKDSAQASQQSYTAGIEEVFPASIFSRA